jgi:hypothetical protein
MTARPPRNTPDMLAICAACRDLEICAEIAGTRDENARRRQPASTSLSIHTAHAASARDDLPDGQGAEPAGVPASPAVRAAAGLVITLYRRPEHGVPYALGLRRGALTRR